MKPHSYGLHYTDLSVAFWCFSLVRLATSAIRASLGWLSQSPFDAGYGSLACHFPEASLVSHGISSLR